MNRKNRRIEITLSFCVFHLDDIGLSLIYFNDLKIECTANELEQKRSGTQTHTHNGKRRDQAHNTTKIATAVPHFMSNAKQMAAN